MFGIYVKMSYELIEKKTKNYVNGSLAHFCPKYLKKKSTNIDKFLLV